MPSPKRFLCMLLPLLASCNFIVPIENDLSEEDLRGRVAMIKENSYRAIEKFGEIQKGERARKSLIGLDYAKKFNKSGQMIEYSEYGTQDGHLVYKTSIAYDAKGKPQKNLSYIADNKLNLTGTYIYDENDRLIELAIYKTDSTLMGRYNYRYNTQGLVCVESYYRSDGSLEWKKNFDYNRRGQIIEEHLRHSDKRFNRSIFYSFDKKGLLKEEIVKDADRLFNKRYVYNYNKKGQRISEESYNSRSQLYSRISYRYDKYGQKIEMKVYHPGKRTYQTYRYDYRYDKKNNWIQCIEYDNENPNYILERQITYHKGLYIHLPFQLAKSYSSKAQVMEKCIDKPLLN